MNQLKKLLSTSWNLFHSHTDASDIFESLKYAGHGFAAQLCSLTVTNSGQRADARDSEEAWLEFRERGTAHRIYVHSLASD